MGASLLLFSLLSLFQPQPKPSADVQDFVQTAEVTVQSYEDESVASHLERPYIAKIETDIATLAGRPYAGDDSTALMDQIMFELGGLHAYDDTLQHSEFI